MLTSKWAMRVPSAVAYRWPGTRYLTKLSADDVADYAAAGFDGVAGKPVNVRELALAVAPFMVDRQQPANDD